jgi:hypothetical protein
MGNLLLSVVLAAGLMLPIGGAHAQGTATVTATCKDGTAFTGTKRAGACRGHGGVQSWGEATSPANAPSQPAPTTSQRATPGPAGAGQRLLHGATVAAMAGILDPRTAAFVLSPSYGLSTRSISPCSC